VKIGVDIGTSLTKAVLFDDECEVLARHSAPTQLLRPGPGQYEVDFERLVQSVVELLKRMPVEDVDSIALTGQGDGLWLLDGDAQAVRPAITWLDARGAAVCDAWAGSGVWQEVFSRTHNAPFPGAGAAVLLALERSDPLALDAATTATQCQHAVFERLTGVRTATPSCAVLPVFDPIAGDYDEEAIRLMQLGRRRDLLPPVSPAPVARAPMRDQIAHQLHMRREVLVATGPYDLPAAALGVGQLAPGDGVLILGTTLACMVLTHALDPTDEPVGLTLRTGDTNGWLRAMPAMVGTACLDWVLRLVGGRVDDLGRLLSDSPPGARGVAALPFLAASGERAPFADPAARAELNGLTLEATPADVVRAMCEALGFAARQCFEAAGLTGQVTVCGGGAASADLVQLFADVLERPLAMSDAEEPTARGAVIAAMGGHAASRSRRIITPRPAHYCAGAYGDYVDRVNLARQHHWRKQSGQVR
jgi:erythritol kinase (D-erythritol 1-phosphate-forming)